MIDPGAAQAIAKQLNKWYRKRAKPHGTVDHYYRGIRMTRTKANRIVFVIFWLFLLAVAVALYLIPGALQNRSWFRDLHLKIGWLIMIGLLIVAPLRVLRDFVVITEDGLIKIDFFGREKRMAWKDIRTYQLKPDSNEVTFIDNAKGKLKMNLAYDGWQDFLDAAAKHLNPMLLLQFSAAYADLKAGRKVPAAKKTLLGGLLLRKRKSSGISVEQKGRKNVFK